MLFVAICFDKDGAEETRLCNRAAHLDYLRLNAQSIKTCGPFIAENGVTMIGSMLIVEAEDRKAAEALLAREPYTAAGLFKSVELLPWRWVIGAPIN